MHQLLPNTLVLRSAVCLLAERVSICRRVSREQRAPDDQRERERDGNGLHERMLSIESFMERDRRVNAKGVFFAGPPVW